MGDDETFPRCGPVMMAKPNDYVDRSGCACVTAVAGDAVDTSALHTIRDA
jgi:hypothetical protein